MNLSQIQELIKFVAKSGVTEVEIEQKDFKITIKAESKKKETVEVYVPAQAPVVHAAPVAPAPQPAAPAPAPAAAATEAPAPAASGNVKEIKSPMIGTFYRSKSPDKPPFVQPGDVVKKGQVLCIIEAMKLFNEIEAEFDGKIVKVLADDSQPVEYDQPMFLIEPTA